MYLSYLCCVFAITLINHIFTNTVNWQCVKNKGKKINNQTTSIEDKIKLSILKFFCISSRTIQVCFLYGHSCKFLWQPADGRVFPTKRDTHVFLKASCKAQIKWIINKYVCMTHGRNERKPVCAMDRLSYIKFIS